jgi:membrane protein
MSRIEEPARVGTTNGAADSDDAGKPTDLAPRSWSNALKRAIRRYRKDNLSDAAAALTYYAVLAMFPAFLVFVALVGIFGEYPQTTDKLLDIVGQLGPSSAVETFRAPIEGVVRNKGGAGALLGVGLLAAIWSASAYVGAFMRASNRIYEIEEGRPFWKLRPIQVLVTILMVVGASAVALSIAVTGPLAEAVGDAVGLGSTAVTVWDIAKWPVLALIVVTMFAVLCYAAPNARVRFRWLSPGGVLALAIWLIASALFAFYVGHFGSYNATYGSLGGIIIFLIWMWLTNIALLAGLEFNAELEREREMSEGNADAREKIQLEPRDVRRARRRRAAKSDANAHVS